MTRPYRLRISAQHMHLQQRLAFNRFHTNITRRRRSRKLFRWTLALGVSHHDARMLQRLCHMTAQPRK